MPIIGAHMLPYTPEDEGYGITVMMTLAGGVQLQLYEPRHAMAIVPGAGPG